jgi:poly(A) polymerase
LHSKKTLDRSILCCGLLFPILEREIKTQFVDKGLIPHIGEIMLLTNTLIKSFLTSSFSHFPKKNTMAMSFVLSTQYRLTPVSGRRHPRPKLMRNKEFEMALIFLKIRSYVNPKLTETYAYWREQYKQVAKHTHSEHRPHHHRRMHQNPEENYDEEEN